MKKVFGGILFALFITFSIPGVAQFYTNEVFNRKAVYAEVFGTGIGATINYEYLYKDHGLKQGIRGGAGYFADLFDKNNPKIISGNIEYVSFIGPGKHQFEAGLGLAFQHKYYTRTLQEKVTTIVNSDTLFSYIDHNYKFTRTGPAIVPRIGYRYQAPDGGFVLRLAYTPLLYFLNSEKEYYDGTLYKKTAISFQTKLMWGGVSVGVSFY